MKKRIFAVLVCVVLAVGLLAGCGETLEGTDDPRGFVGYVWSVQSISGPGIQQGMLGVMSVQFKPDGTGNFKVLGTTLVDFTWTGDNNSIKMTVSNGTVTDWNYTVSDKTLVLTSSDKTMECTR